MMLLWACWLGAAAAAAAAGGTIDFGGALSAAFKFATLIHVRFDMGNPKRVPFFQIFANMPSWGFDIIKYKVAKKMVDAALAGSSSNGGEKPKFIMIFGGTSVTAGHDSYYNQSYPFVAERRLIKVFEALGIELHVRNIAMGANNCLPSDHCYNAQGGDNADWISWEQSFNCGKANNIFETMMRVAAFNKAVVYFTASGGFMPTGCGPSNDSIPWIMEHWTPEAVGITDKYTPTRNDTQSVRNTLHEFYMEGNSVTRFTAPVWPHYNGVGPHGQSVWARSPSKGTPFDYHGACLENGGPHWMVKETATYTLGHGASHHPSWGMHLLRGETIAYWYLHVIIDAIYEVQEDVKTASAAAGAGAGAGQTPETLRMLSTRYQAALDKLQTPIPAKGMICSPDCDGPLRCYTNFEPHFNPAARLERLFVNTSRGAHFGWVYAGTDDLRTFPATRRGMGYKDHKTFWEATDPDAALHLRIDIRNNTFMRLCSYNCKECLRHALLRLEANVSDERVASGSFQLSPEAVPWKHRHVGDECRLVENLPRGRHVLAILVNKNLTVRHRIALTHAIMFA